MKPALRTSLIMLLCLATLGVVYYGAAIAFPHIDARFMPDPPVNHADRAKAVRNKLAAAPDAYSRWVSVGSAAYWTAWTPAQDEAIALANETLALAPQYKQDWNYGNALHGAHSALGLIALRTNDRIAARKHLIASASTSGSPQMDTFGPNMGFAAEMIRAGEREAALEYFALCRKFWEMGQTKLSIWEQVVREGGEPKFGANLLYN
jgi:hypothetical protein